MASIVGPDGTRRRALMMMVGDPQDRWVPRRDGDPVRVLTCTCGSFRGPLVPSSKGTPVTSASWTFSGCPQVPTSGVGSATASRCGSTEIEGLNETLLATATEEKLLRNTRLRADTTVVPSNVSYPTDSGLLAKAIGRIAATQSASRQQVERRGPRCGTAPVLPASGRTLSGPSCAHAARQVATRLWQRCGAQPVGSPTSPRPPPRRPSGY